MKLLRDKLMYDFSTIFPLIIKLSIGLKGRVPKFWGYILGQGPQSQLILTLCGPFIDVRTKKPK